MIDTGAGVIDSDYRGPLRVLLFNFSDNDFESKQSTRQKFSYSKLIYVLRNISQRRRSDCATDN